MSVKYVDPKTLRLRKEPQRHDVRQMVEKLRKQGQIEPVEVDLATMIVDSEDWWAEAEIVAAIEEGWPTVIVCQSDVVR